MTKKKLLPLLLNKRRKRILKECIKADIDLDVLKNFLSPIAYSTLWEHINILKKAGLIEVYKCLPEDHKRKKGRPFKLVTPAISKEKLSEINKELEEIKKLAEKANEKYEKMYGKPKTRKIFKGIK